MWGVYWLQPPAAPLLQHGGQCLQLQAPIAQLALRRQRWAASSDRGRGGGSTCMVKLSSDCTACSSCCASREAVAAALPSRASLATCLVRYAVSEWPAHKGRARPREPAAQPWRRKTCGPSRTRAFSCRELRGRPAGGGRGGGVMGELWLTTGGCCGARALQQRRCLLRRPWRSGRRQSAAWRAAIVQRHLQAMWVMLRKTEAVVW